MVYRPRAARFAAVIALLVPGLLSDPASGVVAPIPWATSPQVVPDTVGQANPLAVTAPDGTDVVLWGVAGSVATQNVIHGKVRLPGRSAWLSLPATLKGQYLGVAGLVGAPDGGFWVLLGSGSGTYQTQLVHLNTRTQRWSRPVTLFKSQTANYHSPSGLGLAADGTLVVTASAPPVVPPAGDPAYRLAVTTKKPGGKWTSRFLSPLGKMTSNHALNVNPAGDILVSFVQGYNLADMTARVATQAHGARGWKFASVSTAGDAQRVRSSLAKDGTAAVLWAAPASSPFTTVRLSTRNVRRATAPWVSRDVVTGGNLDLEVYVVAGKGGKATAVWRTLAAGSDPLWSRYFDGTAFTPATQVTPTGEIAELNRFLATPGGSALLVYQRFSPAIHGLATEARILTDGALGSAVTLIGDESTAGATNSEQVSVDAASRGLFVYAQGTYPGTTVSYLDQPAAPAAMTGPTSGSFVSRAAAVGDARVGKTLSCRSGYWVEAAHRSHTWTRNGVPIVGATHPSYRLVAADRGKRIACRVVAGNSTGSDLTLVSPARRIGG